ncbi:hypothetical protein HY480_03045 [Candidatus Uhrbacteria bacterium]|nr:hypothetical protein [Candidatus Uhrbacteria bacterium]
MAVVLGIALIIVGTFAWGALRGAPWVPTRSRDIPRIIALAAPRRGELAVDLGCGSGGVLAAFARVGCRVRGWELAILPWTWATFRLFRVRDARVMYGDFWSANLRDVDIVYAFLMPAVLERLAEKLRRELSPGARVITYAWPLPGWTPITNDRTPGRPALSLYRVPEQSS